MLEIDFKFGISGAKFSVYPWNSVVGLCVGDVTSILPLWLWDFPQLSRQVSSEGELPSCLRATHNTPLKIIGGGVAT